jgi:hypothetical protein
MAHPFVGAGGTFFPALRASDNPIAIACFGLVTFLPLRPLFSLPCFIAFISVSTLLPAAGLYFRVDPLFFALLFLVADFFVPDFFAAVFFLPVELFFVAIGFSLCLLEISLARITLHQQMHSRFTNSNLHSLKQQHQSHAKESERQRRTTQKTNAQDEHTTGN